MTAATRLFDLSQPQLDTIFENLIIPRSLPARPRSVRPTLVLVGGQSGAGTAPTAKAFQGSYPEKIRPPVLDNEFRHFHPRYSELLATRPALVMEATDQAASAWMRMGMRHAATHKLSLILTDNLRWPGVTVAELKRFRAAGYHIHFSLLSVPAHVSRLAAVRRFGHEHRSSGAGLWTPLDVHEAQYAGASSVLSAEMLELCDRVSVYDRSGRVLARSIRPGLSTQEVVAANRAGRLSRMTQAAASAWLTALEHELAYLRKSSVVTGDMLPMLARLVVDADGVLLAAYSDSSEARMLVKRRLGDEMDGMARGIAEAGRVKQWMPEESADPGEGAAYAPHLAESRPMRGRHAKPVPDVFSRS